MVPQIGIVRNKTNRFKELHKDKHQRKQRFKRPTDNTTQASPQYQTIQLKQLPQWHSLAEKARLIIAEVTSKQKQLSSLNQKRLAAVKDIQQIDLDKKIAEMTDGATRGLFQCQRLIKVIKQSQVDSNQAAKIKQNVTISLANQVQNKTKSLRNQQKKYYDLVQKYTAGGPQALRLSLKQQLNMKDQDFGGQQLVLQQIMANQRNNQIVKLVDKINQLSTLFRDLGNLILQQGTLLDRIDFNIQQTVQHCQRAKQQLVKAQQHQKNNCANRFIVFQIIAVIVLCIVLIVKKAAF